MKIVYTSHASKKFTFLKELGWDMMPLMVDNVIKHPSVKQNGYAGTTIATGPVNVAHELRVVYSQVGDIITIVTFYPIKKGRYDKK